MIKTRFAPSPTGQPHIGNIRTAIFAWLFARANKGKFILRIEDTDKTREKPGSVSAIIKTMKWLGLDWDNNDLIFQSKRIKIYQKYAQKLVEQGLAYVCTCSSNRLKKVRQLQIKNKKPPMYDGFCRSKNYKISTPNSVIRLKVPKFQKTEFKDLIRGSVEFKNSLIDDQVLLKSDGFPTYHLANVIDDHLMKISHVIRADEWLSSTPKHLLLYRFLNWQPPKFAHVPMIIGKDKAKLSKRHGAVSALEYQRQGYLAESLFNYLVLLGWHLESDQEIFSKQELINKFSLDRVLKSPAVFDQEKLNWINAYYIRQKQPKELLQILKKYQPKDSIWQLFQSKEQEIKTVKLIQERLKTLADFNSLSKFIVQLPNYQKELLFFRKLNQKETKRVLNWSLFLLKEVNQKKFTQRYLRSVFEIKIKKQGLKFGPILHPLRVALTGLKNSPGPFETAEALGKDETLVRIKKALEKLT